MAARDPSPFPGMDPYLETDWPDIHVVLIGYTRAALNACLPSDLVARGEQQVDLGTDPDAGGGRAVRVAPDVRVEWDDPGASAGGGTATLARPRSAVALAPIRLPAASPRRRWIEIRDAGDGQLVTVVEFLSPANKFGDGRRQFLRKRDRLLRRNVSCVEVDLTRAGDPSRLVPPTFRLPVKGRRAAYRTMIFRPTPEGPEAWLHPMPLRDPLPTIRVPLRPGDEPAELPLQPLLDRAYVEGRYGQTIRYDRPPDPPLSTDDAAWAAGLVGAAAGAA